AVDMARIYAVRGIVKNANQLAANTALSYYDGLLKDVYGLYAISQQDPELGQLLDDYVKATVFHESEGTAAFTFFRGQSASTTELLKIKGSNLANPAVLRKQIEEYMKFRGPVIIVQGLLSKVEQFTKLKNDTEAIYEKMQVDEDFEELSDKYEELYYRLRYNDYYIYFLGDNKENPSGLEIRTYNDINKELVKMPPNIRKARQAQLDYAEAWAEMEELGDRPEDGTEEERAEYDQNKQTIQAKLDKHKKDFEDGTMEVGAAAHAIQDDVKYAINCGDCGSNYYRSGHTSGCCLHSYKDNLEKLVTLANDIDGDIADLKASIQELEGKLDNCSDALAGDESSGMRYELKQYEAFFFEGLPELISTLKTKNTTYLNKVESHLNYDIYFGSLSNGYAITDPSSSASMATLRNLFQQLKYDYEVPEHTRDATDENDQAHFMRLWPIVVDSCQYDPHYTFTDEDNAMQRFSGMHPDAEALYIQLSNMYQVDGTSEKPKKSDFKDMISKIGKEFSGKLKNLPVDAPGANSIPDNVYQTLPSQGSYDSTGEDLNNVAGDENWGKMGDDKSALTDGLDTAKSLFDKIADIGAAVADKGLLLTYDSEMFSAFPTLNRDKEAKSMTEIPFSTKMNYLLGSEMEYLLIGSKSEVTNLAATSGLLFLTRFVFNYISTFSVPGVKTTLNGIQVAFSALGPFAVVARELARVGMAMAESVLDVLMLCEGKSVAVIKSSSNWQFLSLSVLTNIAQDMANDAIETVVGGVKRALMVKLNEIKGTWGNVNSAINSPLNQAQEIDDMVRNLTGGDLGIGDKAKNMQDKVNGFDFAKEIEGFENTIEGFETPKIEIDLESDFEIPQIADKPRLSDAVELLYEDYLRIYLFLMVDGDTLGKRTSDLIALNLTNYKQKISESGEAADVAMGKLAADSIYKMSTAETFVGVKTTLTMDFLFLSMDLMKVETDGGTVRPPQQFEISETDYRGY
ncbi:DUF5702 domain-containing protein, partial [Ruminococcaceae bacterium OttesenSCG-928-L11]|nr:DUF5702 domain-containing protein [Ruminococcaceae bacterium OttesenSCG-928-L11]